MFKLSQGPVQFLGLFLAAEQKNSFWNGPDFGTILVLFFGPGTRPGNDFLPLARLSCTASWAWKNAFCGWVQMKQVLAVRVGAKKAVGHIVSKKWWPTVDVSIRSSFWLTVAARLNWAGRRWVRTLKRTFGISQRCLPLAELVSVYHVQAKPGAGPIFGTFFGRWAEEFFFKRPRFWNHFGSFFWAGNTTRERLFAIGSIILHRKLGLKKCILWLSADETSLSSQSGR